MFYSEKHNHIHIHNPKTGGKSLMFAIGINKYWKRDYPMHVTLPIIQNRYRDLFNIICDFNKTVTIRNPWSHAVSYYYHAIDEKRFFKENFFGVNNFTQLTKSEKLNIDTSFESFISNIYKNKYSQENYIGETNQLKFNKIFRYENWQEILDYFSKNYDINMSKKFNHHSKNDINTIKNIDVVKDYRQIYNNKTIQIINNICSETIRKFNYEFE